MTEAAARVMAQDEAEEPPAMAEGPDVCSFEITLAIDAELLRAVDGYAARLSLRRDLAINLLLSRALTREIAA